MLGRLLHTAASSLTPAAYSKSAQLLESATEEQHTRSLLFPDSDVPSSYPATSLGGFAPCLTSRIGDFDDRGGLDLDSSRDFRVIIAQDALGDQDDPCVLLDTRTQDPFSELVDSSSSTQGGSYAQHRRGTPDCHSPPSPLSPVSNRQPKRTPITSPTGPLQRKNRSSTVSEVSHTMECRANRDLDTKDATRTFLGCMFGASNATKSGSSTKMHVLSANPKDLNISKGKRAPMDGSDLISSREGWKREPLARAHTYGTSSVPQTRPGSTSEAGIVRHDTILVTRVFNVNLPESEAALGDFSELPPASVKPPSSYLSPSQFMTGPDLKRHKLREKKTPAFAISILVQLPCRLGSRPSSRRGAQTPRSVRHGDSVSSSFGSELQSSWTFLDSLPLTLPHRAQVDNIDSRIDLLVDHWDVITRTLSNLERQASLNILELLKQADDASGAPLPKLPKEKTMQRTNQRIIQLVPWALAPSEDLRDAALHAIRRVCLALRIPRVAVGRGILSAGPWPEEARWVARFCGGREQNFFLFNLLTAFLGSHTEWLATLAPEWYRRRHQEQPKTRQDPEPIVSRTVVLCRDRSVSRRLIFLLASFLPGRVHGDGIVLPVRPSSSMFLWHPSSQSPPLPHHAKQGSLRRTVNRRAHEHRLAGTSSKQGLSISAPSNESDNFDQNNPRETATTTMLRKPSDNRSIRTTANLPIPNIDLSTRKSSAGTTSTVTPMPTTPVAHFSSGSNKAVGNFPFDVPAEGTDSIASADLARHLRRNSNGSTVGNGGSNVASTKWGSLLSGVSGFWSTRGDSSGSTSGFTLPSITSSAEGHQLGPQSIPDIRNPRSKLEQMADEVSTSEEFIKSSRMLPLQGRSPDVDIQGQDARITTTPLRLKVDENEGVIDVDVGLPGFLSSSLESSIGSPPPRAPRHTPSLTSLDGFGSTHTSASYRNMLPYAESRKLPNVAGFLERYHQDFALQAVRPYAEIEAEIKASMSAEPTPFAAVALSPSDSSHPDTHWAFVCSTLIADVRTFSVKRLNLRRKITSMTTAIDEARSVSRPDTPDAGASSPSKLTKPTKRSSCEPSPDEVFTSELVVDLDTTLTDAIERILVRGNGCASPPSSTARASHARNASNTTAATTATIAASTSAIGSVKDTLLSTYECYPQDECRKLVISALEDVVRSVNDDLNEDHRGRDIYPPTHAEPSSRREKVEENALRGGVRQWLISVENPQVW